MTEPGLCGALARHAAALLAVDPMGLGGAVLRGRAGGFDDWVDTFRRLLPQSTPWRRLPPQIAESRLLGGLDLAATLAAGRPVAERGLLAEASGGVVLVPMAERLTRATAGHLAAALDTGEVLVERDGLTLRHPARVAAILLDEAVDEAHPTDALIGRLAFVLDLDGMPSLANADPGLGSADIAAARACLPALTMSRDDIEALCAASLAFGVASLQVVTLAVRAAKAAAGLAGRAAPAPEDIELAAALVIAPRATCLPASDAPDEEPDEPPAPEEPASDEDGGPSEPKDLADSVVEAARAAIPPGLLAMLGAAADASRRGSGAGRSGPTRQSVTRGRPVGARRGLPGRGARLALVETLRAAAPWQAVRRRGGGTHEAGRILVRRDDLRVQRFKERSESVTIFVVDASGSAALHRLAEVKGAVELILAECYVRRDGVALIAFRGGSADIVLPPTRSLARAKRALAGQPGGGGTPLALAVDSAVLLADAVKRRGQLPLVVLLTDGKANIDRAGRPGRASAEADALAAGQAFRVSGSPGLVIDTAPRPSESAGRLAEIMGARYVPLPYADAQSLSRAVLASATAARGNV